MNHPIAIHENHRRAIASTVAVLDETLCEFDRWADGQYAQGEMYVEFSQLTEQQSADIKAEVIMIRALLAAIKDRLMLSPKEQDIATAIWSRSISLGEVLSSIEGASLAAYGAPPKELLDFLDPIIGEIADRVLSITEATKRGH